MSANDDSWTTMTGKKNKNKSGGEKADNNNNNSDDAVGWTTVTSKKKQQQQKAAAATAATAKSEKVEESEKMDDSKSNINYDDDGDDDVGSGGGGGLSDSALNIKGNTRHFHGETIMGITNSRHTIKQYPDYGRADAVVVLERPVEEREVPENSKARRGGARRGGDDDNDNEFHMPRTERITINPNKHGNWERVEQAKKNTAEFDEARRKGAAGLPQQEVIHVEPDRRGRTPDQVRDLHFKQRGNRGASPEWRLGIRKGEDHKRREEKRAAVTNVISGK